jgi:D-glycero-alpha-D-manno-heptose-7-phosphate kinase
MKQGIYLGTVLREQEVFASAPCRLDVGGTWDLKAFALLYRHITPTTTNMALSLRTNLQLEAYKENYVRISDPTGSEEHCADHFNFQTRFGLLLAIISHFNVHGIEIQLSYEAPPRSGLGGSGVLAVTTVSAISRTLELMDMPAISRAKTVELAHDIEDGLRYSFTGMQDQCAAAYGGVNKWHWTYGSANGKFEREQLVSHNDYSALESRLVVAYVGKAHDSSDVNGKQINLFLNGHTREPWFRINAIANEFASALDSSDWEKAGSLINEETELRIEMVPSRITPLGESLRQVAEEYSAGFATAGAGNGGCVWALCREPEDALNLAARWEEVLHNVETAKVLTAKIADEGLMTGTEVLAYAE